jgi:hypothetical protein
MTASNRGRAASPVTVPGRSSPAVTGRHPLLYRGEHTFCVIAIDAHTTRYIDVEAFHGLLVPSRRHVLATQTRASIAAMGDALNNAPKPAPRAMQGETLDHQRAVHHERRTTHERSQ